MQKYYPIKGISNYLISKDGKVYSNISKRQVNPSVVKIGYLMIDFYETKGKRKRHYIHRLLAETFIPNPENKPQVNHIDGNKLNNALDNLEWVTSKENMQHAFRTGLNKKSLKNRLATSKSNSKPIIDLSTGIVFDSLKVACESLNMKYNRVALRISRKTEKRFMYI